MSRLMSITSAAAIAMCLAQPAAALEGVVATVKPIHSLVAGVMAGVSEPALLVKGAGSPHDYTMRPSDAAALQDATVIFQVGHELEAFLARPLEALGGKATVVELAEAPGLTLREFREGGPFETHGHDDHEDHSGHDHDRERHAGHDHEDDHDHEAAAAPEDDHDHAHGKYDMHLWLDPENAKVMVSEIARRLSEADPSNAQRYDANAIAIAQRLDALAADIASELAPVADARFVVFHDAYQYFEARFDIAASGSITVSPEAIPGAQRVAEIRDRIRALDVACVFAEPQFEPRLIDVVIEGTEARAGVLDPLGAEIADGPDLYFTLLRNLASSLKSCLSTSG